MRMLTEAFVHASWQVGPAHVARQAARQAGGRVGQVCTCWVEVDEPQRGEGGEAAQQLCRKGTCGKVREAASSHHHARHCTAWHGPRQRQAAAGRLGGWHACMRAGRALCPLNALSLYTVITITPGAARPGAEGSPALPCPPFHRPTAIRRMGHLQRPMGHGPVPAHARTRASPFVPRASPLSHILSAARRWKMASFSTTSR